MAKKKKKAVKIYGCAVMFRKSNGHKNRYETIRFSGSHENGETKCWDRAWVCFLFQHQMIYEHFPRKTCSCSLIESVAKISWCWCCRRWQRCCWFLMPLLVNEFFLLEKFFSFFSQTSTIKMNGKRWLKSVCRIENIEQKLNGMRQTWWKEFFRVFEPKCRVAAAGCSITWINFSKDFLSHSLLFMNFLLNNVISIIINMGTHLFQRHFGNIETACGEYS